MALELNASKHRIYEYVESRMSFIAPNLSIIIGASTAAKIMGEALGCGRDMGPSSDSVTLRKPRPSSTGQDPTPPHPHPVIPPRDHRSHPACYSCTHGERMAALSQAGLGRRRRR